MVFSSSYPLLPVTPTTAVWPVSLGHFRKVGVEEAEPEAREERHLTQSAQINCRLMFLEQNRHLLHQIKLWPPHKDGAFKGLGAKLSGDKIFYFKFKVIILFSVLRVS